VDCTGTVQKGGETHDFKSISGFEKLPAGKQQEQSGIVQKPVAASFSV
jgi:hypothetical protein